jgi:hypothetical protein
MTHTSVWLVSRERDIQSLASIWEMETLDVQVRMPYGEGSHATVRAVSGLGRLSRFQRLGRPARFVWQLVYQMRGYAFTRLLLRGRPASSLLQ